MLIEILKYARYYLEALLARPLFFVIPVLLTLVAGTFYIYSQKPNYYSEAFLLFEFQQMPASLMTPTVTNDRLQFVEERVFAKDRLISLADDFNLVPAEARAQMSRTQLAMLVRNKITLRTSSSQANQDSGGSASLRIGFNADDPEVAKDVTSRLVEMIMAENRQMRTSRAAEATEFFTQEAAKIAAHLRTREAQWEADKQKENRIEPSRIPALQIELQAKEQDLLTVNQARLVLDEEVKLMEGQLRLQAGASTESGALTSQLTALNQEIAEKSLIYSDSHPSIRLLKQKRTEIETQVAKAASLPASSTERPLSPELALLAERIANAKPRQEASRVLSAQLASRIEWLKAVIAGAPEVEARLEAIHTERQAIERSLSDMQGKLDTARLGERLEERSAMSTIEVVEAPEVPTQKTGAARKLMLLALAGFAMVAGAAGIFIADSLDKTIRGSFDLAEALEGEELIMIPEWTPHFGVRRWFGLMPNREAMRLSRA
jgi:uncharacterized protein involved in exopolysaccharide biosynthesis